jgi:hypothetical protein
MKRDLVSLPTDRFGSNLATTCHPSQLRQSPWRLWEGAPEPEVAVWRPLPRLMQLAHPCIFTKRGVSGSRWPSLGGLPKVSRLCRLPPGREAAGWMRPVRATASRSAAPSTSAEPTARRAPTAPREGLGTGLGQFSSELPSLGLTPALARFLPRNKKGSPSCAHRQLKVTAQREAALDTAAGRVLRSPRVSFA